MPGLIVDKVGEGGSIVNNNITYAGPVNNITELNELPAEEVKDEQRRYVLNENSYFTYNAGNNTWSIVLEPVEKPTAPKVYNDPVNDLQELAELPRKDLQDREQRFVTLENKYFFYNGDTNKWEPVSPEVEVPFAPKAKELPVGKKDQQYFITEHGTNKVVPDYLLKRGIIVQSQREFVVATTAGINLEEVFRSWQMFSHLNGLLDTAQSPPNFPALVPEDYQNGSNMTPSTFYEGKAWSYDRENGRILLNQNFDTYSGFVSPRDFGNFLFEANFSSGTDNDWMGLIIAFYTDPITGYEHTISVIRCLIPTNGQGDYTYKIVYNFAQFTEITIVDATNLAPLPNEAVGGWAENGPCRVSVVRENNVFRIKTSQFGSLAIDPSTEVVINLEDYSYLEKFKVASKVGFSAMSQSQASFSDVVFTGLVDYIFFDKGAFYETYEYDLETEEYFLQDPQTVFCKDYFGMNRFVDSYMFDKLYYISERDEILCFKGNEGVSWDPYNALSIGSDNKPFLNKADLGSGTPTITRATIAEMIADQENQNEGQIIKVSDASEDPTVDAGDWYYEYLGTLNATLEDYKKLTESEIQALQNTGISDIYKNQIIVQDKSQLIGDIQPNFVYVLDGFFNLLQGEFINVPSGNLAVTGFGFDVSGITKDVPGESIFKSVPGGSANLILKDTTYVSGAGSVFDLLDKDGTHAIEYNDINFSGCASLGKLDSYRQFTGTTCGFYGCADGFELDGDWNGFKLTNTNAFSFGAGGSLFKKGENLQFANRFYISLNIDFPQGAVLCDFSEANFVDDDLFQINATTAKVNGVISDENAVNLVPNITANSPKSLWSNNVGLPNTALEKFEDDLEVSGNYKVNWFKDTFNLVMTDNTVFSDENLPASGKSTKEIQIFLTGEPDENDIHPIPTFPDAWNANKVGTYKPGEINKITLKYIKDDLYFMKIDNTLSIYPPPDVNSIEPSSLRPNETKTVNIYGSFFTPATVVEMPGLTINSKDFINSGHIRLVVVSGTQEGEIPLIISNGTKVTFGNIFSVVFGEVTLFSSQDVSNLSGAPMDLSEPGNARITTETSVGEGYWLTVPKEQEFQIRYQHQLSSLRAEPTGNTNYYAGFRFVDSATGVTLFSSLNRYSGGSQPHLSKGGPQVGAKSGIDASVRNITYPPLTEKNTTPVIIIEKMNDGIWLKKVGESGQVVRTAIEPIQGDLQIHFETQQFDLVNIKFIALDNI